ncbi:hypothetical protein EE612_023965 [Oryza sativa]|nr:hypothetical protein EE612_023965 [Oryza sativa]
MAQNWKIQTDLP